MELLSGAALVLGITALVAGLVTASHPFAIVGLVASGSAAYFEYASGRMSAMALTLMAVGLLALFAEVLLPSGLFGAAGVLLLLLALGGGWSAPPFLSALVAFSVSAAGYWLWRSGEARGLFNPGDLPSGSAAGTASLIRGEEGVAVTSLRPGGTARFGTTDREVRLREGYAEPGERVVVVEGGGMVALVDVVQRDVPR